MAASTSSSSSSSSSSSPPDVAESWHDLPGDILGTVASRLPSLADLHRFRSVCRSWRHAAATCAPPPLPYLMFSSKAGGLTRCFYSLSDHRVHRVEFPEDARHWRCCGSSHGWLAMAGLDAGFRLFNPLTGARIELPPLTTISQVLHVVTSPETDTYDDVYGRPSADEGGEKYPWYVVDSPEGYPGRWTAEALRDDLVQKAVASPVTPSDPSDCTVLLLYGDYKVAYARPGDEAWTSLHNRNSPWCDDLVYHENRFYVLLTWEGSVRAFDFAAVGPRGGPRVEEFAPRNSSFLQEGDYRDYLCISQPSGEIFMVRRHICSLVRTESFEVSKVELAGGVRRWVEVDSLGGCALFLGDDCSASAACSAERGGGCMPNCVYFVADNLEFYGYSEESECVLEVGRCHMKDGTVEGIPPAGCDEIKQHPVWISPSL